ncbi:MAG: LemA family protein [Erysipelotrichaceae bacterium]|nr:LemA family protein [Erysipelotrichaceae bacterium]MBQ1303479.1 LemA family protein [Erysipelotrichaceae bacterium]MBQ1757198.1 LemA family protein [Erysipelotrichaceae bacterium]MBR2792473.1 LemA family protein [Erysipelotrichaceae bacterium]
MKYVLIAIVVLAVLAVLYFISTNNAFVALQNKIEEAFSTMDVYLVKRAELIPNIVATVKGYAKHETETLEKVVAARNSAVTAGDKIAADTELTKAVRQVFALAESYPELKANTNFLNLQQQLSSIEEDIATSRRYYNGVVRQYNTKLQSFPSSLVASAKGLVRQPMFEVSDDSQRQNVKVEF